MKNNQLEYWAIGPTDIPEKLSGTWSLDEKNLYFSVSGKGMIKGFEESYRIIQAENDLFILLRN